MASIEPDLTGLRRVTVVGTTGSGKTTLASRLARLLNVPHVELDALHWEPNWREAPRDVFRARVTDALAGDAWVTDGNYSKSRDIVWRRAQTVVWLDYPLALVLGRLLRRTLRRVLSRETLWGGNRERFLSQFASRESLFLWALKTYPRRKREYPVLLAQPEHAHLTLVRLRSPRAADRWLAEIAAQRAATLAATSSGSHTGEKGGA